MVDWKTKQQRWPIGNTGRRDKTMMIRTVIQIVMSNDWTSPHKMWTILSQEVPNVMLTMKTTFKNGVHYYETFKSNYEIASKYDEVENITYITVIKRGYNE